MRGLRVVSFTQRLLCYQPSLRLQELVAAARKAGEAPDTLLVVQHAPVVTVGKRGTAADIRASDEELRGLGVAVARVPRGGETTYHGPGQLVAYPVLDLRHLGLGARTFVEGLEDAMVHTAGCFGLQARGRVPGKTGVWVGERKLGAVGVRISHGISSHGIALNVATRLEAYRLIVPCGTPDKEVTSLARELGLQQHAHAAAKDGGGGGGGGGSRACAQLPAAAAAAAAPLQPAAVHGWLMAAAEQQLVAALARVLGLQPAAASAAEAEALWAAAHEAGS